MGPLSLGGKEGLVLWVHCLWGERKGLLCRSIVSGGEGKG